MEGNQGKGKVDVSPKDTLRSRVGTDSPPPPPRIKINYEASESYKVHLDSDHNYVPLAPPVQHPILLRFFQRGRAAVMVGALTLLSNKEIMFLALPGL